MTEPNLSPAAQAVLDAAINVAESPDAEAIIAAALRVAVEQVLPKRPMYSYSEDYEFGTWDARNDARNGFLAIVNGLEGTK
jgi:hypothetical protein